MKKNKIVVSLQLTEETNANTGKKWGFYNIYISKFKKKKLHNHSYSISFTIKSLLV